MSLKKPTLVIFDMDGTTVRHLNPRLLDILEKLDDFSYKFRKILSRAFPFIPSSGKVYSRRRYSPKMLVHRTIHKFRRKPVELIVEPCPGIYDVLEFLKSQNVPIGLVSNGLGRGYGHDILKKFNLENFYSALLFAEDINRSKPDPEPILSAIRALQNSSGENDVIWYVGDRHKDITAAKNAMAHLPCKIEPIAYGLFSSAFLAILENNFGTERIFGSYKDMLDKLLILFLKSPKSS